MRILKLLCLLTALVSCSTLKRSITTGTLIGSGVGATGGYLFSPNKESKDKNAYVFGIIGALAGAGLGYLLDGNKPIETKKMILPADIGNGVEEQNQALPLFDFAPELKGIKPEVNFKPVSKYEVPITKLPKALEGKVKKQYVIEYEAPEQTININNRTINIGSFKAWEHIYEE